MEKIKSLLCKKLILNNLDEKRKLELLKYNKKYQKIININLINYLLFKGKFAIFGKNGMRKEYNYYNKKLIFEGKYINGKRNGKGKEYDCNSGKLIFDGEYLNGKKWKGKMFFNNISYELKNGKGAIKEFCDNNNIIVYEGEYLNGEKNGKGKEYYYYGNNLIFDGEYLNGKKWNVKGDINNNNCKLENGKGYIKVISNNGKVIFEGNYLNGERNGKGKEYYDNGNLIYEGEYLNGKRNGNGKNIIDQPEN